MKKFLIVIILFTATTYCRGQVKSSTSIYISEADRRIELLKECNCPNQVFDTDSIYSFFQAKPIKSMWKNNNFIFTVEDSPMPYDMVKEEVRKQNMLSHLVNYYRDYNSHRKEEIIPPKVLKKMLSAIVDSTTNYTQPIQQWNASRLGEKWITKSNRVHLDSIILERAGTKEKNRVKQYNLFEVFKFASVAVQVTMSMPVFDDDYKYAFMILKIDRSYGGSNREPYSRFDAVFALFERKESGWTPILVSRGERSFFLEPMFKL